jgi:DNA-binding SARP family transcriptional activator/DNA-binding beta-propeller fold protein YncE
MEFRILGPLEVVDQDAVVVKLGGAKQRSLLAFLLLHPNEVVSRERLIDELWGDQPPETAATAIQVHVSQLRKALGRDAIVTQQPGYLIRVRDDELDLERFERSVAAAQSAPPAEASELLSEALALWRGPPLAELDAPFARDAGIRLDEQRLAALEQRIDADLALGRHAQLAPELEGLVRMHPLREHLRGQLMVALYRSGRQAEALDVYRSGRRLLDDELGLEPGEELRRLERAILEHDPSLGAPSGEQPGARQPASVPTGTVTFLFTDIEGSTRLVQELGEGYGALLEQHQALVRGVLGERGGEEIDAQGDAFFFAFRRARDAVRGAVELQKRITEAPWPDEAPMRARVGIHTGEPGIAETGYHGLDVVRAARISGSAHGGQILASSATRDLVGAALDDVTFQDLGEHKLKDLEHSQRIFQVVTPGLESEFPPLTTADAARVMTISGREEELASAAEAALVTEERRERLFRRSRVVALVGALIVAAVIAVGVATTTGSGGSDITVVPDSVAVLDRDGKLVGDVPIGGRPISIAIGEGAVWVANADDGTLLRIDPDTYGVVETIGLGADVNSVAVGFGSVWVAGGNSETVFRIDPRENAVEETIHLGRADPLRPDPVFFVAAGRNAVWVTQGGNVLRIDPRTNVRTKTIMLPRAASSLRPVPVDLGAGDGNVWVPTQDERLVRIDEGTGAISATTHLPGEGFSPDVGAGGLWLIVQTETTQVSKLDLNNLTQTASFPFPSTRPEDFPVALATAAEKVWVADHGRGLVWKIASTTAQAEPVARIAHHPISIAATPSTVWVGVQEFTFGSGG